MSKREGGAQLLQELEALSHALYKAGPPQVPQLQEPRRDFEGRVLPSRRRASETGIVGRSNEQVPSPSTDSRHSISVPPNSGSRADFDKDEQQQQQQQFFDENAQNIEVQVQKKSSFWDWKPLRALAHIGQQRFPCEFSAHVHGIEKLPASMNGLRLQVHLKHRDASVHTMPARASHGSVEFEETIQFRCNVYGSKKSNGSIKYMSKSFDLFVLAMDVFELDLGKHKLDLSRILPSATTNATDGHNTWNTSFKLSGKAKGSSLWITFSCEVLEGDGKGSGKYGHSPSIRSGGAAIKSFNSVPSSPQVGASVKKTSSFVDFSSPAVSEPPNKFYVDHLNLDEDEKSPPKQAPVKEPAVPVQYNRKPSTGAFDSRGRSLFPDIDAAVPPTPEQSQQPNDERKEVDEVTDYNVVERGVEVETYEDVEHVDFEEDENVEDEEGMQEQEPRLAVEEVQETQLQVEDVEQEGYEENYDAHEDIDDAEIDWKDAEDMPVYSWTDKDQDDAAAQIPLDYELETERDSGYVMSRGLVKSYESSDEADLVAGEFLGMLDEPARSAGESSDDEPESPRAKLLRQFEQETSGFGLDDGVPEFNLDEEEQPDKKKNLDSESWNSDEDKELAAIMDAAELELQKATQAMRSKARAKMLEDAEAEALLQEWGLNEKAFKGSPPHGTSISSTDSDIASNSLVVRELAPLAPGLGSVVPTSDGGSLRSMNSALFQGASNDGRLVMHVSKPVVVPVEMGSTAMDVLRNMASGGTESMAIGAMQAMPLEDITGKSVEQIAMEGEVPFEESKQRYTAALNALEYGSFDSGGSELVPRNTSSGLISASQMKRPSRAAGGLMALDELAPVAMEKIETLAMQGLKIQCEMADEEAPYTIEAAPPGVKMLEAGGKTEDATSDGMMAMSLSLDEWMKLDAGLYDEEETNEKTLAVLAAHGAAHPASATTTDLILNLDEQGGQSGKLGNTLTLAMLVQLRDPLRNFEPVGAPMMALVEAERVLVPPRPRMYKQVAIKGTEEQEDRSDNDEDEQVQVEQPQFKITGVHMAGLKATGGDRDDSKQKKSSSSVWGTAKQQQSGSRWLVASGMGKTGAGSKHPLLAGGSAAAGSSLRGKQQQQQQQQATDSLWSISSRLSGGQSQVTGRNPDVKFGSRIAAGFGRKR